MKGNGDVTKPLRRPKSNVPMQLMQELLEMDAMAEAHKEESRMVEQPRIYRGAYSFMNDKPQQVAGHFPVRRLTRNRMRDPAHDKRQALHELDEQNWLRALSKPKYVSDRSYEYLGYQDMSCNSSIASSEASNCSFDKRGVPIPPRQNFMFHESRYKTELCRQFMELGTCEYSDRCLFAHGMYELKHMPHRHPKHKTERCSAFHDIGFCAFGPRCSFIHGHVDADTIIENISKNAPKVPMPENPFKETAEMYCDQENHSHQFLDVQEKRLPVFVKIYPGI